ncbi:MAG: hypothetical protein ACKO96_41675, partial [Flammeovirgaceae bacterium]
VEKDEKHKGIPTRFTPPLDDPSRPPQYTKKGELIYGEWVGDKLIRYKRDTTRPECFTDDDWKSLSYPLRKQIIREFIQAEQDKKKKKLARDNDPSIPAMPVERYDEHHREKIPSGENPKDAEWFAACVAKSIGKREALANPAAKASLDKEWDKLRRQRCWNEEGVTEWSEVAAEAKRLGIKAHVGRI